MRTVREERQAREETQAHCDALWEKFPEWWKLNAHSTYRYALRDLMAAKNGDRYRVARLRHAREMVDLLLRMLETDFGEEPVP